MTQHVLPSGHKLAEYRIQRLLGEGGFGLTYLARDTHLDKLVAIKEYLPSDLAMRRDDFSVSARSPSMRADYTEGLQAFIHEGRTLARFDDINIVRVHRFIETNGTAYLVMEYCAGGSLKDRLKRGKRLNEEIVQQVLAPIMNGLQLVHEAGVLHRDIKPANIMFRDNGTPVLIDFGAARQVTMGKSRSISAIVSAGYAPLEQYSQRGRFGPWTDIYALAAVAYHCLTGKPPMEAPDRVEEDGLQALAGRLGDSPFLQAVDRGLHLKSGDRPATLSEWYASWQCGHTTAANEKPAVAEDLVLPITLSLEQVIEDLSLPIKVQVRRACPVCQTGRSDCHHCGGRGLVEVSQTLEVRIPAGCDEGDRILLRGEGHQGAGSDACGDLYLRISVTPHAVWRRDGQDLYMQVEVPQALALAGGPLRVSGPRGALEVRVPAGVESGSVLRLRGQGLANPRGGEMGNLYLTLL